MMEGLLRRGIETMSNKVIRVIELQAHPYLAVGHRVYRLDHLILVGTNRTKLILHFVDGRYEAIIVNKRESTTFRFAKHFRAWLQKKYPVVRARHVDVL